MITPVGEKTFEFRGLSTDTKPITGVGNGSIFLELDTFKVFMFDEENKTWLAANTTDVEAE